MFGREGGAYWGKFVQFKKKKETKKSEDRIAVGVKRENHPQRLHPHSHPLRLFFQKRKFSRSLLCCDFHSPKRERENCTDSDLKILTLQVAFLSRGDMPENFPTPSFFAA